MLLTMESKICLGDVQHLTSHRVGISFESGQSEIVLTW